MSTVDRRERHRTGTLSGKIVKEVETEPRKTGWAGGMLSTKARTGGWPGREGEPREGRKSEPGVPGGHREKQPLSREDSNSDNVRL